MKFFTRRPSRTSSAPAVSLGRAVVGSSLYRIPSERTPVVHSLLMPEPGSLLLLGSKLSPRGGCFDAGRARSRVFVS